MAGIDFDSEWGEVDITGINSVVLSSPQNTQFIDGYNLSADPDIDNDGIPAYLDLDSDGNGCPDALEGDETVLSSDVDVNGAIISAVDANGIPILVNNLGAADIGADIGQGIGTSQNLNAFDFECLVFLPIELISFNANAIQNRKVDLNWETKSELDNDYFTIQRSQDGIIWESLASVNGAGNSSTNRSYQTFDLNPHKGTSYYRLMQTDFDGGFKYSDIQSTEINRLEFGHIYPNPIKEETNCIIFSDLDQKVYLEVIDEKGEKIHTSEESLKRGKNIITFDFTGLPSGHYHLNMNGENEKIESSKLIVVRSK